MSMHPFKFEMEVEVTLLLQIGLSTLLLKTSS